MPLYYFDLRNGDEYLRDDEGTELPGPEAAKAEIGASIAEFSRGLLSERDRCDLQVVVRDDSKVLFQARLRYDCERVP